MATLVHEARVFARLTADTPRPWGAVAAAAGIGGAILTLTLVTYSPAIDGPYNEHRASVFLALLAAAVAAVLQLWRRVSGVAVFLAILLALIPAPLLHAVRSANAQATLERRLTGAASHTAVFDFTAQGDARLSVAGEEVVLRAPAGTLGFLTVRAPAASQRIDLPRALARAGETPVREEVTFGAAITRDNVYFVLVETERLLAELTPWGVALTLRGDRGTPATASLSNVVANGAFHTWGLSRTAGRMSLTRDGEEIWSGADSGAFGFVRLGETRTDQEHGGTLRLRDFSYRRASA